MSEREPYSRRILEYLRGVPSVRQDKVTHMQRLLASEAWLPPDDSLVDRILFEHLLGPFQP